MNLLPRLENLKVFVWNFYEHPHKALIDPLSQYSPGFRLDLRQTAPPLVYNDFHALTRTHLMLLSLTIEIPSWLIHGREPKERLFEFLKTYVNLEGLIIHGDRRDPDIHTDFPEVGPLPRLRELNIPESTFTLGGLRTWACTGNWTRLQRATSKSSMMLHYLRGCESTLQSTEILGVASYDECEMKVLCSPFKGLREVIVAGVPIQVSAQCPLIAICDEQAFIQKCRGKQKARLVSVWHVEGAKGARERELAGILCHRLYSTIKLTSIIPP